MFSYYNTKFIFIDETGDLGQKGSKHFLITALLTENDAALERLLKNIRRNKFRKELKNIEEIKANNSKPELIKYVLKKIMTFETVKIQSIILNKNKMNYKDNKNKLYDFICGYLANMDSSSKNLIIRIDKSKGKQRLIDDFDKYMNFKFKESKWNRNVAIHHSWSHSWTGLQMVDIISWAVFQKFEHQNDEYFNIIDDKTTIIIL
ncbi:MAG: DUF3800 domain-containing protein [Candidatus Nanoarchaeia archaeon]